MSATESSAPTQTPKMSSTDVLDAVFDILKASPVLPLSSASLGSQFNRKVNMPFREATGGVGVLNFLREYEDFEVVRNRVTITGEPARDNRAPLPEGAERRARRTRRNRSRAGSPAASAPAAGAAAPAAEEGRKRKPRKARQTQEGEEGAAPRPPREPKAPKAPKEPKAAAPAKTEEKEKAPKKERAPRPALKAYIVDFDDGCQNFCDTTDEIPEGFSVHVYYAPRAAGSTAAAPPAESKRLHPHPSETDAPGAVQTAITVRAVQLAIQRRSKVEIYLVSAHPSKFAEIIPQIKRFGVSVASELDGTKHTLKSLISTGV